MSNAVLVTPGHSHFVFRKDIFWGFVAVFAISALLITTGLLVGLSFHSPLPMMPAETSGVATAYSTETETHPVLRSVVTLEEARALIGGASQNRISVLKTFQGPSDLTGAVMRSNSGDGIAWITPNGKHIFVGTLMDAQGNNLSKQAHDLYIQKDPASGGNLLDIIKSLPAVSLGDSASSKTLYVFGDMNCRYCEELFRQVDESTSLGAQVKWIPVAILGDKSLDQAASLLSLEANSDRLELMKHHHGALHEAIKPMAHDHARYAEFKEQIERSTTILGQLGQGTPLLAYVNQEGKVDIFPKKPSHEELRQIIGKIGQRAG